MKRCLLPCVCSWRGVKKKSVCSWHSAAMAVHDGHGARCDSKHRVPSKLCLQRRHSAVTCSRANPTSACSNCPQSQLSGDVALPLVTWRPSAFCVSKSVQVPGAGALTCRGAGAVRARTYEKGPRSVKLPYNQLQYWSHNIGRHGAKVTPCFGHRARV